MFTTDFIPLLLAAQVWEIVVAVVFFVLYGIGQLLSAREQAKKKAPRRQRPRPAQAPAGEVAAQPANQEDALRSEVEDFLRRAQGKPPKQEKPARRQPKPKPQKRSPSRPVTEQPPKRLVPARPAANLRREGVAEHVAKHLSTKQLVEHAEHLGDEVALADDRLESRLHEKFDHQLGSLQQQKQSSVTEQKNSNVAAEIAELMRKPGGMRQLIIAQEILRRPERW